jgi:Na+/H+-dicarboxylate symporter
MVLFVAQAFGVELAPSQQVVLMRRASADAIM